MHLFQLAGKQLEEILACHLLRENESFSHHFGHVQHTGGMCKGKRGQVSEIQLQVQLVDSHFFFKGLFATTDFLFHITGNFIFLEILSLLRAICC